VLVFLPLAHRFIVLAGDHMAINSQRRLHVALSRAGGLLTVGG